MKYPHNFEKPKIQEPEKDLIEITPPKFSPYEERIIHILTLALRPLTTRQVSQYSGISYLAAKNNLLKLNKKRYVKKEVLKNRTYWAV